MGDERARMNGGSIGPGDPAGADGDAVAAVGRDFFD